MLDHEDGDLLVGIRDILEERKASAAAKRKARRPGHDETIAHDGGEPLPLFPPLPEAQPFPAESLGPFEEPARAISRACQVPLVMAAQSVLAAATLAAQAHADLLTPFGQSRPLSLYFLSLALSGDRKTSADKEAAQGVEQFEAHLQKENVRAFKDWKIAHAAWLAQKRKIETDKNMTMGERTNKLRELGDEPEEPLKPFVLSGDLTLQGLMKAWPQFHASLGLFTAEGGLFTNGHAMSEENRVQTGATLNRLWDGAKDTRIRAGSPVASINGKRLCVNVMIQPDVAAEFLSNPVLRAQGTLGRFLIAAPESVSGTRFFREPDPADTASIASFALRVYDMLSAPARMTEETRNELNPRAIPLSDEARAVWIDFYNHVEGLLGPEGEFAGIREFACKAAEQALRLAGVITMFIDMNAAEIDAYAVSCGVNLVGWYLSEQIRLASASRTNPKLVAADKLLKWMQSRGEEVSFRDILTLGPAHARAKDVANDLIGVLIGHGWVIEISKRPRVFRVKRGG